MSKNIRAVRIDGNIAYLPLTQGYEAIIDADLAPFLGQWLWQVTIRQDFAYAVGRMGQKRKTQKYLHRVIAAPKAGYHVDHINGNGLDNRRENLRVTTMSQNLMNQRKSRANTSGFKGVSFHKQRQKWRACIKKDGKYMHLGLFNTPEAAYAAYCEASAKLHGEFGRVK